MPTPRWFRWCLVLLSMALGAPGAARAQEGAQWDDAPDPAPSGDELVPYDDRDPRALTDFKAELDPHGSWRDDPTYGWVWVPHRHVVGPDFAPYVTSGHWALADDGGWIWVSDYPWGWVTFHYGRWVWIAGVGWAWVPGRQYAHAWVTWRVGEPGWAYIGWAPMPPEFVWYDGVAVGVWFGVYTPWVFCPSAYVFHHHVHTYVVHDHHHVHDIAAHSHRYVPPRGAPVWAGPSPLQAHVPAKAVPKRHTPAHPKAVAASRQKASERQARFIPPDDRHDGAGARPSRDRPYSSRSLPGGEEPSRSYRTPPARLPGARPGRPLAPPDRGAYRAPPGRAYRPDPGYSPRETAPPRATPSRPPAASRPDSPPTPAPSRLPPPSYRAAPPRVSAPAPVPSYRPPAPALVAPGRPRRR